MAKPAELSEETIQEKTGKSSSAWYALIDAFGGQEKGHTAIAKFLHTEQGLSGWWAQAITNRYEHARALRND